MRALALSLGLVLATAAVAGGLPVAAAPGAVHATLPAVTVADLAGRVLTTDQLRGRVVVLNVWATWCAPCRREMPSLDALYRGLDPARFVVAGISVDDDPVAVREYLAQYRLGFPNFIAAQRSDLLGALGVRGIPATFIVAADGTILQRHSGPRDWNAPEIRSMLEDLGSSGHLGGAQGPGTTQATQGRRHGRT